MELVRSKKRLLLAAAIIITTITIVQNSYNKRIEAQPQKTATTAVAGDSGSRGHQPSKPLVWFLGSTLLGLVGLKRFGLNQK